jgi:hypothetical protein
MVKKVNRKLYFKILLLYLTLLVVGIIFFEKYFIFVVIPFLFIANTIFLRVLFFNSITKRFKIHDLEFPYDPVILYPGMLFSQWDKSVRSSITVAEVVFSILIVCLPLLEFGCLVSYLL